MRNHDTLSAAARQIRHYLIKMTTAAGSGHLSSSLSAVELMVGLLFSGVFRANLRQPDYPNNDRLVFSKGHAAPLLYALYAVAGRLPVSELQRLRKFGSRLEGHPMPSFRYTEVPTGSLGQGLSIALGQALAASLQKLSYRVYCLLGDAEMTEGSVWEAVQLAGHLRVGNLVGIIDLNGFGQTGPTMLGRDARAMAARVRPFGWETVIVDGHDLAAVVEAYRRANRVRRQPVMIIAKTFKGRGVARIENKPNWHGRVLTKPEAAEAIRALGRIQSIPRLSVATPERRSPTRFKRGAAKPVPTKPGQLMSVREALGRALVRLGPAWPAMVVLDGEVKNSTYTELFERKFPRRFFQGHIGEQNLVGLGAGLARRGLVPVTATFAAFFTRAFDQLRMLSYSQSHAIFIGTHAGAHIGQDGVSQMGLQDLAMFRTLENCSVLYPSDAVAAEKLLAQALRTDGLVYLRATRQAMPVLYASSKNFPIGGSQTLRSSSADRCTVVAAGATVYEAVQAADVLRRRRIHIRVIDAYSVKPLDVRTLKRAAQQTRTLIVVEDHYPEGGLAEAVRSGLGRAAGAVISLSVNRTPRSGTPADLYRYERLDAAAIITAVQRHLRP